MTNHIVDANKMVPPPHLLKKFSEQARVDSKKRGHSGYCKTFAKLCIDWALNSQPSAALAQPEPVAPTDEKAWQWYSYCPDDGIELHSGKKLAQKAAQEIMGSYAKNAHSDGWHEDMDSVSWGMLLPEEQAQVVERTEAEPDSEFDEWVRYELVPARWGTPANNTSEETND